MLTYNKQYVNVGMVFMDCDPGKGHPQPSKHGFKKQGYVSYLSPHTPVIASTTINIHHITLLNGRDPERVMSCRALLRL